MKIEFENIPAEICFETAHHATHGLTETSRHTVRGTLRWRLGSVELDYTTTDAAQIALIQEYNTGESTREPELQALFEQWLYESWETEIQDYVTMSPAGY